MSAEEMAVGVILLAVFAVGWICGHASAVVQSVLGRRWTHADIGESRPPHLPKPTP